MKNFNAKILAIGVLALTVTMSKAGAQYGYQQSQPAQTYQQYQNQQSYRSAPRRSYNAPISVLQNHRSLREQFNPCNTNYGVIMDGWHDAVLLMTVKSIEGWAAIVSFFALFAVVCDDLHRRNRAKEVLESFAGAVQICLNDRSYCLRNANEAIDLRNKLVIEGNSRVLEAESRSQAASTLAIRTMAIQAAESGPTLEAAIHQSVPVARTSLVLDASTSAPVDAIGNEEAVASGENEEAEQGDAAGEADGKAVRYSTLDIGGKKYKVPDPVRLSALANNRKIENMRTKINELEDRLKKYEKA